MSIEAEKLQTTDRLDAVSIYTKSVTGLKMLEEKAKFASGLLLDIYWKNLIIRYSIQ